MYLIGPVSTYIYVSHKMADILVTRFANLLLDEKLLYSDSNIKLSAGGGGGGGSTDNKSTMTWWETNDKPYLFTDRCIHYQA